MSKADDKDKQVETLEVGDEVVAAVADKVQPVIESSIKDLGEELKTSLLEAVENTRKKNVDGDPDGDGDPDNNGDPDNDPATKTWLDKDSKEIAFMRAAVALVKGNSEVVAEYNKRSMELRQKAGYGNTVTDADGGYLVPPPDFDAEVERLEEEYGVALKDADVRRINSNSVLLNKKGSGFEFVETSEAEAKTGLKFTIAQVTASLRKFAGIVPATDELVEDSAVDYWAEVAREAARAYALLTDKITFTDATSGIMEIASTAAHSVGNAFSDLDWDDLLNAEMKVPSPSTRNGKWYMHRTVLNALIQKKADQGGGAGTGQYMFSPNPNALTTPWGRPIVLTEVLPASSAVGSNKAFAVFGDLSHYKLYVKNGLQMTALKEATVKDADGNTVNLALQDMSALRMVVRLLGIAKFPEAFCIVGTGSVS